MYLSLPADRLYPHHYDFFIELSKVQRPAHRFGTVSRSGIEDLRAPLFLALSSYHEPICASNISNRQAPSAKIINLMKISAPPVAAGADGLSARKPARRFRISRTHGHIPAPTRKPSGPGIGRGRTDGRNAQGSRGARPGRPDRMAEVLADTRAEGYHFTL